MIKQTHFIMMAGIFFLLSAGIAALEPATVLHLDFEEIVTLQIGMNYVNGVKGKGLFIDPRSEGIDVSLPDQVLYNNGTLMFWVKPNWHLYNNICHKLVYIYDETVRERKSLVEINKGKRGAENLLTVSWDGGDILVDSHWLKELNWNHIALTWNRTSGKIALYINGQLAAIKKGSIGRYLLGKLGLGIAYSNDYPANASFDEVYFMMRELSAREIVTYSRINPF